jgi:hypothetical protein
MRMTVTTSPGVKGVQQFEEFAAVAVRARHLLAENLGASRPAQLLKLGVERLPIGADAGIAKAAGLQGSFSHMLPEV